VSSLLALSYQEPGKVTFYNVVLFVHIAAAVVAFGVTFAYPFFNAALRKGYLQATPYLHHTQGVIGKLLITPAAVVILVAGIYLAAKGPYDFGDGFVGAGTVIIVILLGLGGAFFSRKEDRLFELATQAVAAAAGGGEVVFGEEYERTSKQVEVVGMLSSALVLLAVFLMVVKPGV
jgi:uncharacterized membrane protein